MGRAGGRRGLGSTGGSGPLGYRLAACSGTISGKLLHLLGQGVTVSAAAAAVHVSVRTAHRRLEQARAELGVATTGEAILAASQEQHRRRRLVGRDAERAEAMAALARTSVVIVGTAGMGKTALVDAIVGSHRGTTRRGAGLPSRRWESFRPLVEAVGDLPADGDAVAVAERVHEALGADLLAVDDLQWADEGTIDVLERIGGQRRVLASARPDEGGDAIAFRLREAGWVVIRVAPLTTSASEQLLAERRPGLSADDIEPVVAAACGNPLLLLTIGGREDVRTLTGSLRAQLDAVPKSAQRALALVGVAERPLPLAHLPEGALELVAVGLADLIGEDLWPRHQLHASVAADLLTAAERREAHRHLASVLPAGEAARHLVAAGDHGRALARALEAAGRASTPRERASHLELAATCAQGEQAPQLFLEALDASLAAGAIGQADHLLGALDASPGLARSEIELRRAQVRWLSADPEGARAAVAAGLTAERGQRTATEVRLRIEELRFPIRVDWDPQLALALGVDAVALADEVGIERARTRGLLASAHLTSGSDAGVALLDDALRIARAEGDLDAELEVGHSLTTTRLLLGPAADTRRLAGELERRAEDAHRGRWRMQFRFHRLLADLLGDPGAEVLAEVADLHGTGSPEARAWIEGIAPYAVAVAHLGRVGAARRIVADTLEADLGDDTGRCLLHWARAEIELADGRPEAALLAADECLRTGPDGFFLKVLAHLVRRWALLELGQPVPTDALPGIFPVFGMVPEEAAALALLDHAPADAANAFRGLADAYAGVSARAELRCRWGLGEAERRAGCDARAIEVFREVARRASDRGLMAAERMARASLRGLGASERSTPRGGVGALTRREDQVLRLVADGGTSTDIARRLGVAPATVESNITSAMRKLGATNRRQAVALHLGRRHAP